MFDLEMASLIESLKKQFKDEWESYYKNVSFQREGSTHQFLILIVWW